MLNLTKSDAFYSCVGVCVCVFVCLACRSRAHVNLRQTWCLYALVMTIFLPLSNQVWTKETILVDDSCNVSSLLYYSPLQLLITNVVVSFCFLLIDFASTLTDKLVKLKVFCSFSLLLPILALTIFAPFVFSYFWEILTHYGFLLMFRFILTKTKRINPKRQK